MDMGPKYFKQEFPSHLAGVPYLLVCKNYALKTVRVQCGV